MATKHFCDGCDKEVALERDIKRVRVSDLTQFGGQESTNNPRDFDLCGNCYSHFKNSCLPTNWTRVGKAAA